MPAAFRKLSKVHSRRCSTRKFANNSVLRSEFGSIVGFSLRTTCTAAMAASFVTPVLYGFISSRWLEDITAPRILFLVVVVRSNHAVLVRLFPVHLCLRGIEIHENAA